MPLTGITYWGKRRIKPWNPVVTGLAKTSYSRNCVMTRLINIAVDQRARWRLPPAVINHTLCCANVMSPPQTIAFARHCCCCAGRQRNTHARCQQMCRSTNPFSAALVPAPTFYQLLFQLSPPLLTTSAVQAYSNMGHEFSVSMLTASPQICSVVRVAFFICMRFAV